MFAATLQPSWPSRPKTDVTSLFYFLKLYNFGLNEIFVGSTISELQHPWISKITTEPKKNHEKIDFRAQFWSASNQYISMKFYIVIAICLNLNLWIHKNFACPHHGHEKWAYFYVMEAKIGHFSVFFYLLENWLKYFFFSCPPEKFYDIWAQLTKFSSKSEKVLINKILWRFRQIGKRKFSQLH